MDSAFPTLRQRAMTLNGNDMDPSRSKRRERLPDGPDGSERAQHPPVQFLVERRAAAADEIPPDGLQDVQQALLDLLVLRRELEAQQEKYRNSMVQLEAACRRLEPRAEGGALSLIGVRLVELMLVEGVPQADIATAVGVSRPAVSRYRRKMNHRIVAKRSQAGDLPISSDHGPTHLGLSTFVAANVSRT